MKLLLFSLTLALAAERPTAKADLKPPSARQPALEFESPDANGTRVGLKDYRGKVVLLDFWATWCGGCKQELPWFATFERKYRDQGLAVVGVSLDDDGWKVVKPFLAGADIPFRILLGNDALAKTYKLGQMPDAFLIDRRGRLAATYVGLVDRDNIEANLRTLLSEP